MLEALDLSKRPVTGRDLDHLCILCPERVVAGKAQQVRVEEPGLTKQVQWVVGHRRPRKDSAIVGLAPDLDGSLRALGVPILDGGRFVNDHQGPMAVDKRLGYPVAAVKGQGFDVHDKDLERLHRRQQQVVALLEFRVCRAVPVRADPLNVVRHVLRQLLGHPVPVRTLVAQDEHGVDLAGCVQPRGGIDRGLRLAKAHLPKQGVFVHVPAKLEVRVLVFERLRFVFVVNHRSKYLWVRGVMM